MLYVRVRRDSVLTFRFTKFVASVIVYSMAAKLAEASIAVDMFLPTLRGCKLGLVSHQLLEERLAPASRRQ